METLVLKTNLHCNKCVSKIEPLLKNSGLIHSYSFNLEYPDNLVTVESENLGLKTVVSLFTRAGY